MKPSQFAYHRPETAAEAVDALAQHGDRAKVLAGGQSLIPLLALRLAAFDHLVDIGRIDELRGIERRDDSVWIGAGTRQSEVESSTEVAEAAPLVARATSLIGHFQIRNRGTFGGSLAHADPAAEYPAVALALDAQLEILSPTGTRTVGADEFFTGTWTTVLEPDELLTGVTVPAWRGRRGFAIEEFARRHGDFAIAGAAVGVGLDGDDRVERCAIGLIGLGPTAVRATAAEAAVLGDRAGDLDLDSVGHAAVSDLESIPSDLHGSGDYRARVGAAMVTKALTRAIAEAADA